MNQYWDIVNGDKREILHSNGGVLLHDILHNGTCKRLEQVLTLLPLPPFKVNFERLHASRVRNSSSTLLMLPREMLDQIISFLPADAGLRLALCCSYLFRVLGPVLRDLVIKDEAPWAGDRIIIVSDLATGAPNNCIEFTGTSLLKSVGMKMPQATIEGDESNMDIDSEDDDETMWAWQNPLYHMHKKTRIGKSGFRKAKQAMDEDDKQLLDRLVKRMKKGDSGPRRRVLRNLDTKQQLPNSTSTSEGTTEYDLGQTICLNALWTDVPQGELPHLQAGGLDGNEWAGNRFEIVYEQEDSLVRSNQ